MLDHGFIYRRLVALEYKKVQYFNNFKYFFPLSEYDDLGKTERRKCLRHRSAFL